HPVRRLGLRNVRKRGEELVAGGIDLGKLRLELLELRFEGARCLPRGLDLRVVGPAGAGRLLDLARELVLFRADLVDPGVELAPSLVPAQELVELPGRSPPRQRGADRVGIAADLLQVERGRAPSSPTARPTALVTRVTSSSTARARSRRSSPRTWRRTRPPSARRHQRRCSGA